MSLKCFEVIIIIIMIIDCAIVPFHDSVKTIAEQLSAWGEPLLCTFISPCKITWKPKLKLNMQVISEAIISGKTMISPVKKNFHTQAGE